MLVIERFVISHFLLIYSIYFKPNTLKALEAESLHGEEAALHLSSHSSLAKLIIGSWLAHRFPHLL